MSDPIKLPAKKKFIENIISVKVWIIFSFMLASGALCMLDKLDGATWAQANGTVISLIVGMREAFKTAKINTLETKDDIEDVSV